MLHIPYRVVVSGHNITVIKTCKNKNHKTGKKNFTLQIQVAVGKSSEWIYGHIKM